MCDYTEKNERKQRKKCENTNKAVLKNILWEEHSKYLSNRDKAKGKTEKKKKSLLII